MASETTPTKRPLTSAARLVCEARFCAPDRIFVQFADDLATTIAISDLGLSPKIDWTSLEVTPSGDSITVGIPTGERVPIDASTFRYVADPEYAARVDRELDRLKFSDEELARMNRESSPPEGFFDRPAQPPKF